MTPQPDLVYYPDDRPGITRRRCGRGFTYLAPDGTRIEQARERKRIEALAVPPAYERVWISPRRNGHLQATGKDSRARKQYRYHPDWRAWREATKFESLAAFGDALPAIRRRIRADLAGEVGDRDYAIAAVLALIDRLALRVGAPDSARENKTYGATTLTNRHVRLTDGALRLRYRAKGGHLFDRTLRDSRLMKILNSLHDLPGATLASWIGDDGKPHEVSSDAVNARLAEITGESGFTAKTFRTWAGSEAALLVALKQEDLTIKAMSEAAAERLHNTPSIARNSYIHPEVIALSERPADERAALSADLPEKPELRQAERALLKLLA
ncbi:putative DNA topoisomerase I protein [Oceanicola granulosus HTCC2516]|uniref:DNA topoisomerase n=1 Tax=Oceanicola granulosus (strain ATCC BAA-861 / DSM 15982 / KCTC 12143 / HTCC2516) TaxID=314256 RepID=Q2CK75_OCEGH|nr:DNA topoisomerase IB [Oceanicola granulosus]EAR52914.1 putative DNA topoisomerase I protein [Oceanicola granulosus HTCC2516]